jgi:GTP-binding protein
MAEAGGWRPDPSLPEVAVAGRSNVGKSTLINRLVRQRGAARVSRTPGRTQQINFFRINDAFVLVDLPGYGYARVAKATRASWRPLIDGYLRSSPMLRGMVLLLDVRREPSADDRLMLDVLADAEIPALIAVTKIDTLAAAAAARAVETLTRTLALDADQVIPVSAVTGQGRDELAAAVVALVETTR